jgi:hypothetical protein
MKQRYCAALLVALAVLTVAQGPVHAGLNAGATARFYWENSSTHLKSFSRDETSCTPKAIVAATGIQNFRGANVQIRVAGGGGALPPSWQIQSGGCANAAGTATLARSGFPSGMISVWASAIGVTDAQSGMYYIYSTCLTPHGIGVIWLESAGTTGINKASTTEYGLYAVTVDQSTGLCLGDCLGRDGPVSVCLCLYLADGCPTPTTTGNYIQLMDGNLTVDNCPVVPGFTTLTWNAGPGIGLNQNCELLAVKVQASTWGKLRKAYR